MRKDFVPLKVLPRLAACVLLAVLLGTLCACAPVSSEDREETLNITATTYPLYVLTAAITAEAEGVEVRRLNTGSVSCLHDYTLTVSDMRALEQADLLILNGAGLEDFLSQALTQLRADRVDCSRSVSLLEGDGHTHHHEENAQYAHDHEHDPHYWMDPRNLISAAQAICNALCAADPDRASLYQTNAETVSALLESSYQKWRSALSGVKNPHLITFHDGFSYFAEAFGLTLLFSMEEEDGATASAKDILTAANYVKEYSITAIFTEVNGSGAAARAVSGETGAAVYPLSMLMDGEDAAGGNAEDILTRSYLSPMEENIATLSEVLQ